MIPAEDTEARAQAQIDADRRRMMARWIYEGTVVHAQGRLVESKRLSSEELRAIKAFAIRAAEVWEEE